MIGHASSGTGSRRTQVAAVGLACVVSSTGNAACPPALQGSGDGTYYDADGSGNCSYPADPSDEMIAAINAPQWEGSAHCGECLDVTGPLGSVRVRVVDQCPECQSGDLDLHPAAFARIANIIDGRVPISWKRVDCPVTGNTITRVHEGSNSYYVSLTPDHHRHGIVAMSLQVGTTWQPMPRQDYNAFVLDDGNSHDPPIQVRLEATTGETIEQTIQSLGVNAAFDSGQQFPACVDDLIFANGFDPAG